MITSESIGVNIEQRSSDCVLLISSGATACECVHLCVHIWLMYTYRVYLEGGVHGLFFPNFDKVTRFFTYLHSGFLAKVCSKNNKK